MVKSKPLSLQETAMLKVLLVEDNPGDADLIRERIEEEHIRPIRLSHVNKLSDAQQICRKSSFDLILLDLGLPDSSGISTFDNMKMCTSDIPIVVLTGHEDYTIAEMCIRNGAQDYLIKGRVESYINGVIYNAVVRAQMQRALYESYENLQSLLAANQDAILVLDKEGNIKFANAAASALFDGRVSQGTRFGLPLTNQGTGELEVVKSDGSVATVEMRIADTSWFGEAALVVFLRDFTQQKKDHDALIQKQQFSERLLETAQAIVLVLDHDGRIVRFNQYMEILCGYRLEEVVGKCWFETFIPKDDMEEISRLFHRAMQDTRTKGNINPIITKSGEKRLIEWYDSTIQNAYGRVSGLLCIGQDITRRRRLEAQLAQSDRLSSMGMLAAGVAHEINNPLTYILYNLETLVEVLPELIESMHRCRTAVLDYFGQEGMSKILGESPGRRRPTATDDVLSLVVTAADGARRVKDIVRDLKVFSRVDDEHVYLVSVEAAVETAVNMAFNEIKYRAKLMKDYESSPKVKANDGRLSQVFLNILMNAAHAIEEGNVERNTIRIRLRSNHEEAFIEISDTGKGIPKSDMHRLFEPFYTTKPVGIGSGLGLSICHQIVTSYGGRIEVESEIGAGSAFRVCLPIFGSTETIPNESKRNAPEIRANGRILVVDDEEGIRLAMTMMLEPPHELVLVSSGKEAKEILATDSRFDIVLCDLMMPNISGMELHDWMVEQLPELAKRVIFISGGVFTERAREYMAKVSNEYIEKPFDAPSFKRLIAKRISDFNTLGESEGVGK